jgi:myo-inositol 2-dehydrogenase / D-chiro-inositol 1-dehydrogenase
VNVGRGIGEGSADMVTAGDTRWTSVTFHSAEGVVHDTVRRNSDLFHDAYTSELAHFVECVRNGMSPDCTGEDARSALEIALAAIESVKSGRPVRPEEVEK